MAAGYSGTRLAKKLGIREGMRLFVENAPRDYRKLVAPLPNDVAIVTRADRETDLVHFFTKERKQLEAALRGWRGKLRDDAVIWLSWPKKSAGVATDVSEDTIREVALPLGLVDVKVCAVDEVWSGLKLVLRREHRKA
jgi:hypothetical protein